MALVQYMINQIGVFSMNGRVSEKTSIYRGPFTVLDTVQNFASWYDSFENKYKINRIIFGFSSYGIPV